jgi:hypothetical protein
MVMNEKILKVLSNRADFYPQMLEQHFPHLLDKIIETWDSHEFDSHLNKLMLDNREQSRQGFPPAVASELLRLSILHSEQYVKAEPKSWIDTSDVRID